MIKKFCKKCDCETDRYPEGRCIPCNRLRAHQFRTKHPEKTKEYNAAYYAANADREKAAKAAYYVVNLEKVRTTNTAWRRANREAMRIYNHNYCARKRANGGVLSTGLVEKLFKLQRGKCACGCGLPLGEDFHRDHIMPVALGGTNTDDNIQLLRQRCNNQKHAKHPVDFMQSRGFLL